MFLGQRGYVVERGSRGGARALHTMWWRDHGPTAPPRGVGAPLPLSVSSSGSGNLRVNMDFAIISGVFPKSRFSAQKRDTRAILLKTALAHVSSIQNTQVRIKTTAKMFGKVDTFWTYHTPQNFQCSPRSSRIGNTLQNLSSE